MGLRRNHVRAYLLYSHWAAKFVETLQRSNEQLVKLATLVQKKESQKPDMGLSDDDKAALFEVIKS